MAGYLQTHPWLTFTADLQSISWQFWLIAGEALSKCEHLAGVALGPDAARELMQVYLVKGAVATTAIEGNTLTEEEVLRRAEGSLELPPSKEYLGVEVDNVLGASNELLREYSRDGLGTLTAERIKSFNRQILRGLDLDEHVVPGELRTYSVGVADYRGAPAADLPELLEKLCAWLASPWLPQVESLRARDQVRLEAMLKAIVAHLYLAWIHPFGDGNGRTARLVEVYLLLRGGIPSPAAHLLSNHYNETRSEYYRQLSYASKSGGDITRFCTYAVRGFVDQLRQQIELISSQQLRLFWQNHVHQTLGDSETGRRRRYLVLDLAKASAPVSRNKLQEVSVRVLRHYLGKDDKTFQRDLRQLEHLGLIERVGDAYRARTEIVRAYMAPEPQGQIPRGNEGGP